MKNNFKYLIKLIVN